jgi:hypothetical protein
MKTIRQLNLFLLLFFTAQFIYGQTSLPINYDSVGFTYILTDFGNGLSSVEIDPVSSSNKVVKTNKPLGAASWAGVTLGGTPTTTGFNASIPFAINANKVSIRVYSPDSGIIIKLKIEDATNGSINSEVDVRTKKANAWDTLIFDFATGTPAINYANSYKKMSLFFNFGVDGNTAGNKNYYFDDVMMLPPTAPISSNVTFSVDMKKYGAVSGTVYVNGTFNSWCGACNAMVKGTIDTNIWTTTLPITNGPIEFKYTINGWNIDEKLTSGTNCTITSNGFTNRATNISSNTSLPTVCWESCVGCNTIVLLQVNLPVYFDSTNVDYLLSDFGGNVSSIVTDISNVNNKVVKIVKPSNAQGWAGTTIGLNGFSSAIPFSSNRNIIKMKVYSPAAGMKIRIKAEDANDPTKSVETDALTTLANTWETLEFNFSTQATGTASINYGFVYKKLSAFFNFGIDGATAGEKIFYFDNIEMAPPTPANVTFNVNMKKYGAVTGTVYLNGTFNSWCGSCNPMIKGTIDTNIWSVTLPINNGAIEYKYTINGWDKDEKLTSGNSCTITSNGFTNRSHNITSSISIPVVCWEECTNCITINPNELNMPVTFESSTLNYGLTDFGGNASSIVVDPSVSSNKACKVIKTDSAATWAGTTIGGTIGLGTAIPFTSSAKIISMRVYSPSIGTPIRMKVEDPNDAGKSVETEAITTIANAWQTLEFNFANQATGTAAINLAYTYKKLSVFFNFGTTGAIAGEKTYYFDDITFGSSVVVPQLNMPVTFESTTLNYGLTDFGGNASSIVTDPSLSSNKACKVIKSNTAETWAGTTIGGTTGFGNAIPFSTTATKISMRVFSPSTGTPVRMKVEDPNDAGKSVETEATTTVANAWQTLEFNFANQANGTAALNLAYTYKKMSVFFNFGTTGATAGEKIYYFDDVTFGTITPPTSSKVNIIFSVDAKNVPLNANDTVTINGTFNGWCGACNPMTKTPGTNIWSTTIALDTATEFEFKYTVGAWASQENLASTLSCTKTTGNFTNRVYRTTKLNDSIPLTCWESCTACTGTGGPTKTYLTFQVDMAKNKPAATDTVTLNGTFNGWCGACTPMTKKPGTEIYMATLLLDKDSAYDFKYSIGNWTSQELLKEGMTCTTTKSGFTNRTITVSKVNDTIPEVCWESCAKCVTIGVAEQALNNVKVYPNPTTETLFVELGQILEKDSKILVYNMLGELMISKSSNQNNGNGTINLDTHSLKQGIYLLKIEADNAVKTIKFQIN